MTVKVANHSMSLKKRDMCVTHHCILTVRLNPHIIFRKACDGP